MKKKEKDSDYEKGYEARFMYKCRLCGQEYYHMVGGWHKMELTRIMCKFTMNGGLNMGTHEPDLFDIHVCRSGEFVEGHGLSDFIGIKKVKS